MLVNCYLPKKEGKIIVLITAGKLPISLTTQNPTTIPNSSPTFFLCFLTTSPGPLFHSLTCPRSQVFQKMATPLSGLATATVKAVLARARTARRSLKQISPVVQIISRHRHRTTLLHVSVHSTNSFRLEEDRTQTTK